MTQIRPSDLKTRIFMTHIGPFLHVLQRTALQCNTPHCFWVMLHHFFAIDFITTHCNMLQQTATPCNTTLFLCNASSYRATRYNILQHTASHCITLHHAAPHCSTLHHTATYCTTLQHTATYCTTLCVCMP